MLLLKKLRNPRIMRFVVVLWAMMTVLTVFSNVRAYAQDPVGAKSGTIADAKDASGTAFKPADDASDEGKAFAQQAATEPLAVKLADSVGHAQASINMVWTLVTGFLVMFMQAGFAMVETGFCRAKHAAHVVMTNFLIYPIGMLGFWICGFALMFGSFGAISYFGGGAVLTGQEVAIGNFGLFGTKGFFLGPEVYDSSVFTLFLFQMVFMDTTCTIPTGAMAERWRFSAFIVYGFFISMFCYPIYGHLVWGGGGLAMLGKNFQLGHGTVDFAGSSVVHAVGGFVALAGSLALGPRIGKFTADKKAITIAGHDIPMAAFGTFILAFGWFGFNAGSTLAGNDMRISVVAVNTMLASAGGAMSAAWYMYLKTKKWDPGMMVNGMLAGLVAITAPCAFVNAPCSVLIGVLAGLLVIWSVFFIEKRGIDDPVGAVSVHGVCGIFGLLCVGIFADGTYGGGWNGVDGNVTGLLFGGNGVQQFMAQAIGAVVCMAWSFGTAAIFFAIQKKVMKIRPTEAEELEGLDMPEMGVYAYPAFAKSGSE